MGLITSLRDRFASLAPPTALDLPAAGIYHYLREQPGSKARLHLRLEADGKGLLLVNASRVYHLNPSAASMAYFYLEGRREEEVLRALTGRFRVSKQQAREDYQAFLRQMEVMAQPGEHCAVCEMETDILMPFSARPSAPYRMDLALSYRCNNNCSHCYNARPRTGPELSTGQWKHLLDKLWAAGIPHIVFTGGEPTLRPDLPELIAHAEQNGQITGVNTNGRKLKDAGYVQRLVEAGLDHVQITLESHEAAIHDLMVHAPGAWQDTVAGVKNALASKLFVMTNTTLLRHNAPGLPQTLDFLAELGLPTIGLNALIYSGRGKSVDSGLDESELPALLNVAREATTRQNQRLIWYTPTQYCQFDPLQLNLGVKGCTAALYSMCIEPDGSVLPCQSYYTPIGNLLLDTWPEIWNHELAVSLRERKNLPIECQVCALLLECGGGCPLARDARPDLKPRAIEDHAITYSTATTTREAL